MNRTSETLELIREMLQDEERALMIAERVCREVNQAPTNGSDANGQDEAFLDETICIQQYLVRANLKTVFANAESPIEKMFFGALVLVAQHLDAGVLMLSRVADVRKRIQSYLQHHQRAMEFLRQFQDQINPRPSAKDFCDFTDWLVNEGRMPAAQRDALKAEVLSDGWIHEYFHVAMQAGFPDVIVDGRSTRSDAFVWVPTISGFKLVVECDGWKWHGNKRSFTADRVRDRAFHVAGYSVLRYSGTEIFRDPVQAGANLLEHIISHREALQTGRTATSE